MDFGERGRLFWAESRGFSERECLCEVRISLCSGPWKGAEEVANQLEGAGPKRRGVTAAAVRARLPLLETRVQHVAVTSLTAAEAPVLSSFAVCQRRRAGKRWRPNADPELSLSASPVHLVLPGPLCLDFLLNECENDCDWLRILVN